MNTHPHQQQLDKNKQRRTARGATTHLGDADDYPPPNRGAAASAWRTRTTAASPRPRPARSRRRRLRRRIRGGCGPEEGGPAAAAREAGGVAAAGVAGGVASAGRDGGGSGARPGADRAQLCENEKKVGAEIRKVY
ncbi:hypothetical protein PVAP13_3NG271950 [Panicum virgatum]|uniref:Uncharacterized protein n=1 Tax=Panicum virgatum TaxID=38727 RepID=A0A8T0UPN9_PANVG|nr:hypothetical protein PVAP13_3NG271950 [Panicum virgatum]